MATNIQWILYKNTDGKILVKVLFNEQETKLPIDSEYAPYYDWKLFQKYCEKQMAKIPRYDTGPVINRKYPPVEKFIIRFTHQISR